MDFHSLVDGKMSSRGTDAFGSGQPGSPRDGGRRSHGGIDIIARPGARIYSPLEGEVIREASPYKDDPRMRGVLIRGHGEHQGWQVKLFYVLGLFSGGVSPGQVIGHAQDLSIKYPHITNHVHMEVLRNGMPVDPREPFRMCF